MPSSALQCNVRGAASAGSGSRGIAVCDPVTQFCSLAHGPGSALTRLRVLLTALPKQRQDSKRTTLSDGKV